MAATALTIASGSLVGLSLGLTGSGGSILAIPLLVYALGVPVSQAIIVSLLMVAAVALFGAVRQSFSGNVDWRMAVLFSLSGMVVSPIVIHLAHNVNETLRLTLFAGLMLFVAYRMAFVKTHMTAAQTTIADATPHPFSDGAKTALGGAAAGSMAGFFGIGGGFVIVPLLIMIFHTPYRIAVGTSLASIFLISSAAVSSAVLKGTVADWPFLAIFVGGGIAGMLAGSTIISKIPDRASKLIFAGIITMLAVFMLIDRLYIHRGGLS